MNNEELIQKVSDLYNKNGVKSVTMDDVARELGMSKKTLYQHFKDKDELVEKAFFHDLNKKIAFFFKIKLENKNAIDELLAIQVYMTKSVRSHNRAVDYDIAKYHPKLNEKIKLVRRESIYAQVFDNLEKGISDGLYRSDINCDIITRLYVSRIEYIINNDYFTQEDIYSNSFLHEIFRYHIHGISSQKGLRMYEKRLKELNDLLQ